MGELESEKGETGRERDEIRQCCPVLTYMGRTSTVLYSAVLCPCHNITPRLTPTPGHQLPVI